MDNYPNGSGSTLWYLALLCLGADATLPPGDCGWDDGGVWYTSSFKDATQYP